MQIKQALHNINKVIQVHKDKYKGKSMKNLKLAMFIALFINSVVYATSGKLSNNSTELVCHQMNLISKSPEMYGKSLYYMFHYKNYIIHYEYKIIDVYKSKTITNYEIKDNNESNKKFTLKDSVSHDYTNANVCEDSKHNHYFVLEQGNFESEDDDGRNLTGKIIEIINANNKNNDKEKYFYGTFYDQYFKVPKKQTSQFHIFAGYSPEKLLSENKPLPIAYTMYEKDGGLYLKVGSTYKSDIITLKKPINVK